MPCMGQKRAILVVEARLRAAQRLRSNPTIFARDARRSRAVLVQPSVYGTDNTAMLDAVAPRPCQQARVVAVRDTNDEQLRSFHAAGARDIRGTSWIPVACR